LSLLVILAAFVVGITPTGIVTTVGLQAGVAKVDITDIEAGPVDGHTYVWVLAMRIGSWRTAGLS
jgi:hypothetical protein